MNEDFVDNQFQPMIKQVLMPIKAVIFDLDDTLWPQMPLINHAEQVMFEWLQTHAPKITDQHTIQSMRSLRAELLPTNPRFKFDLWALRMTMLSALFTAHGEDLAKVESAMQVFAKARNQVSIYDDVMPTLTTLADHFKLGSISNGFANLDDIGLSGHFKVSLAAHQFGCAKPDPRIFLAACDALNVLPEQAVYVGDDVVLDVQGAQQAGLKGVWINRAGRASINGIQADCECADLTGLLSWLKLSAV